MLNMGVYLSLLDNKSFHTIILKKRIGDFTYLSAIGYEGGGVYGEFYGKFWYEKETNSFTGLYSRSTGSLFWETKLISLDFNDKSNRFDSETINFEKFMESDDEKIQYQIFEELKKYIYYGYDEETDKEYQYPKIKSIDLTILKEFESDPGNYCSINWNNEYLEITNSDIWGLSLSFPHIIDLYQ